MKTLATLALVLVLAGCQTFYSGVVTVTQVRDDVMKELAQAYKNGYISPETDQKIAKADTDFRNAAKALRVSLEAYKAGTGTEPDMTAVKSAVSELISISAPYVLSTLKNQNNLNKATQL